MRERKREQISLVLWFVLLLWRFFTRTVRSAPSRTRSRLHAWWYTALKQKERVGIMVFPIATRLLKKGDEMSSAAMPQAILLPLTLIATLTNALQAHTHSLRKRLRFSFVLSQRFNLFYERWKSKLKHLNSSYLSHERFFEKDIAILGVNSEIIGTIKKYSRLYAVSDRIFLLIASANCNYTTP
jgi:hypothetical protein